MHDVGERLELGVLAFDLVTSPYPDECFIDLSEGFDSHILCSKLIISESGSTAESGVILSGSGRSQIVVVAGAYPCSLGVDGVIDLPHVFEPEYPLDDYVKVPV
jgi:hypothetical protein